MSKSSYIEVPSTEKSELTSDSVLVEAFVPESVVVLPATMHREDNIDDETPEQRQARKTGAGILCGVIGCLLGGPFLALGAGVGAVYATSKEGAIGDIARACGDVALTTNEKARAVDEKHDVWSKIKSSWENLWSRTKAASKELFRGNE